MKDEAMEDEAIDDEAMDDEAMNNDGNGSREVGVASWGERLTRISAELTNVKQAVVVVVVVCTV